MNIRKAGILIKNSLKLVKRSDDPFSPVKEAVTNSLDSIKQRQEKGDLFSPLIKVILKYKQRSNTANETETFVDGVIIEDNGLGFYPEGINRWWDLAEDTKKLNNRGTGKMQMFHRFKKIEINSIFFDPEVKTNRKFQAFWDVNSEYGEEPISESDDGLKTVVTLTGFYGSSEDLDFYAKYISSEEELKKDVIKNFLLRLFLEAKNSDLNLCLDVVLNDKKIYELNFNKDNIPRPEKIETITVSSEKPSITETSSGIKVDWIKTEPCYSLEINRFEFSDSEMDGNIISQCSKGIGVNKFKFPGIRKEAVFNGKRYISSISGELFDNENNVNDTRDGFDFKSKKQIEAKLKKSTKSALLLNDEPTFIFQETINQGLNDGLSKVYSDIKELQTEKLAEVIRLANEYGIPLQAAETVKPPVNASEDEIVALLFEAKAKNDTKKSIEINRTYKELRSLKVQSLNPLDQEKYRERFEEISNKLLGLIPQQNKDDLAGYVIRRDMLVEALQLATDGLLEVQQQWQKDKDARKKIRTEHEAIIHDLLFKRKCEDGANDLWVFNEEFVHFDGCSDIPLQDIKINGEKLLRDNVDIFEALEAVGIDKTTYVEQRPDVLLFPEEGKCVIFEFKAPGVDLADNTNQIPRYAKLIANYSREPNQFKHFFGFLVGEKIDKVHLDTSDWRKVPYGNGRVCRQKSVTALSESEAEIATLNQEIWILSEVASRAKARNRSFAKKLGIEEVLLTKDS